MGKYHNKLDKKYFNKSIYMKKFVETFNIKLKDNPLQYELVYETYNTFIILNNTFFSLNYIPIEKKVNNMIDTLYKYLSKYKNKIKKCYDSQCILLYESFENMLDELNEMKELHTTKKSRYNLKSFEETFENFMNILDNLNFDKLVDSKDMPFVKQPNDKLPKKVNLKLMNNTQSHITTMYDITKQDELNKEYIENYSKIKFDLEQEQDQQYFIFDTLNRIKDINNAIVDYYTIDKDTTVIDIFNSSLQDYIPSIDISKIKDIEFVNVFNQLEKVCVFINNKDIDKAFKIIKDLIDRYKNLYERMS